MTKVFKCHGSKGYKRVKTDHDGSTGKVFEANRGSQYVVRSTTDY